MSSDDCKRCGHYDHTHGHYHYCPNCGASKLTNSNIIDMPVVRERTPLAPIVMGNDEGPFNNTHIEMHLVTVNTVFEGKLLALLPPDENDAGWTALVRADSEQPLNMLRNKLAEVGKHLLAQREAAEKLQAYIDELEKKRELAMERLVGEREERTKIEARFREEAALRCKLEVDIAKIRQAIGSVQMDEILTGR